MELIDTHAHFTFSELQDDVDNVLARSIAAGVTSWVTVATEPGELEKAIELANNHENMHVALGYHPHHAKDVTEDDLSLLKQLAASESVVAVGETGLAAIIFPPSIKITFSHVRAAKSILHVAIRSVCGSDFNISISEFRLLGSRLVSGSSIVIISGSIESTVAIAAERFCPADR